MEIANWFVIVMGLVTVFVGLICIIIICSVMGALCKTFIKEDNTQQTTAKSVQTVSESSEIPDRQKLIAASCAVIAEELGTDVEAIKVLSFKKM